MDSRRVVAMDYSRVIQARADAKQLANEFGATRYYVTVDGYILLFHVNQPVSSLRENYSIIEERDVVTIDWLGL